MKNFKIRPTLITLSTLGVALFLLSWGVIGHERINRAAVMALPKPLQTFFYNHIDFITQESTVPDLRRNVLNDKMELKLGDFGLATKLEFDGEKKRI